MQDERTSKSRVARWALRVVAVAILVMGALPKFTGGADVLADRLPGGGMSVLVIGVVEVVAITLLLTPRLALVGSALTVLVMGGAVVSHLVGPVGMEGDFASMFVMALIALAAGAAATVLEWRTRAASAAGPETIP